MDTQTKGGLITSNFTEILILTLFLLIVAVGVIILVLVYQKKQLQYLKEKQALQNSFQQELLRSQLEIQEQTFKNISLEIHDNIGQVLTLVKLNINAMKHCLADELTVKVEDTSTLVTKAIQDLRNLSKSLNAGFVADMGLIKSIEYELNLLKKIACLETRIIQDGTYCNLSHQKELILFRIFQEVLNNIIKHSKATMVEVLVNCDPTSFLLKITDNGDGFDVNSIAGAESAQLGLGIRNMQNRSHLIGADYNIDSEPGKGTTITINLACDDKMEVS